MKVKRFFVLICLQFLLADLFSEGTNIFSKNHLYLYTIWGLDLDTEEEIILKSEEGLAEDEKVSYDSIYAGGKFTLPFLDLRLFGKSQESLDFESSLEKWKEFENLNVGIALFTEKLLKDFSTTVKYGNLKASAIVSKLNNPLLSSSISPFASNSCHVSNISASLPTYSSFSNPLSFMLESGFKNRNKIFDACLFNAWMSQEKSLGSVSIKIVPSKKINLEFAGIWGLLPYEEFTGTSWWSEDKIYYHKGNHFCSLMQTSLGFPHFNTLFSFYIYESPFGTYDLIYKSENSIKAKLFTFNFSALLNQNKFILTSSQNKYPALFQLKSGIQNNYKTNTKIPLFIKTGVNSYFKQYLNNCEKENEVKNSAGLQLSSLFTGLTFLLQISGIYTKEDNNLNLNIKNYSLQLKNNWNLPILSPTFSAKLTFDCKDKEENKTFDLTQKYSLNLQYNGKVKVSNTNSINIEKKKENTQWEEKSDLSVRIKSKTITYFLKLSIVFQGG
ncbi:MAG: hypothetical protein K5866_10300 [Treponema sp.]|nr:hypothetical protein [Treponema sp.]